MKKSVMVSLAAVGLTTLVAGGVFLFAGTSQQVGYAENTVNLFTSDGVDFTTAYRTDKVTGEDRSGLLFTATENGSSAEYDKDIVGRFEADFLVFSENSFSGDAGSATVNDAADINLLTFSFNDLNNPGNGFDVVFAPGYTGNMITPTVRVSARGEEAGIIYSGIAAYEDTAYKNNAGLYTALEGSSFSNLALKDGATTTDVESIKLSFDPDNMCVYAQAGGADYLVWNFSQQVNDGRDIGFTLDKFDEYRVSVEFTEIVPSRTAKMLMYSINGRELSWHYISDSYKTGISVDNNLNAVVGEPFKLPKPVLSDNVSSVSAFISGPYSDNTVVYSDGCTFTPQFAGDYLVTYTALSATGKPSSVQFTFTAVEEAPAVGFAFADVLYGDETVGAGTKIYLPACKAEGGLMRNPSDALVTVTRNGEVINGFDGVAAKGFDFTLATAGNYVVSYASPDGGGSPKEYSFTVKADAPVFDKFIFPAEAALGDEITLPDPHAKLGGTELSYEVTTTSPSGAKISGNAVSAAEQGAYTTEYAFNAGGTVVRYTRNFVVRPATASLFVSGGANMTSQTGKAWYNNNLNGLILSANSGFSATYTAPIDMAGKTKDDLLIELAIIPDEVGIENFKQLTLTFSDVEDDSNAFKIDIVSGTLSGDGANRSYVKAAAPNQILSGRHSGGTSHLFVGGFSGTFTVFSFSGTNKSSELSNKTLRFYYDDAEKAVYLSYTGNIKTLIADFDSSDDFSTLWGGFTSGKANLTVRAGNYTSGSCTVLIKNLDGFDLSKEYVNEDYAPILNVDLDGYAEDSLPVAVKGKSYKIFPATAYKKVEGKIDCGVKVYRDYNQPNQTEVEVTDGAFITEYAGKYTIVYTAADNYGHVTEKILTVTCEREAKEITASGLYAQEATLGIEQELLIPVFGGGSGRLQDKCEVFAPDGSPVEIKDGKFLPVTSGEYSVVFTVTDYLGDIKEFKYVVTAEAGDTPIANNYITLAKGYVAGFEYTLPTLTVRDYAADGAPDITATISVWNEGKSEKLADLGADNIFRPLAGHVGKVVIVYTAQGVKGAYAKDYPVTVADAVFEGADPEFDAEDNPGKEPPVVKQIDKAKLFVTDGCTVALTQDGADFKSSGAMAATFINVLTQNNLSVAFTASGLQKVTVTFSDGLDDRIALKLTFAQSNKKTTLSVNGGEALEIGSELFENGVRFAYAPGNNAIKATDSNTVFAVVTADSEGRVFNGFPSGYAFISFSADAAAGSEGTLTVNRIGGQSMDSSTMDYTAPMHLFQKEISGRVLKGERVVIPAILVKDVLSPSTEITVTVTRMGKAVTTVDGAEINNLPADREYVFSADLTGTYLVVYAFSDCFENTNRYTRAFTVSEMTPPTITVDGEVAKEYSLGSTLTIPAYSVTDNDSAESGIKSAVYVITPTGEHVLVTESFTFKVKGKYILRYIAYDNYYNQALKEYEIEVA